MSYNDKCLCWNVGWHPCVVQFNLDQFRYGTYLEHCSVLAFYVRYYAHTLTWTLSMVPLKYILPMSWQSRGIEDDCRGESQVHIRWRRAPFMVPVSPCSTSLQDLHGTSDGARILGSPVPLVGQGSWMPKQAWTGSDTDVASRVAESLCDSGCVPFKLNGE